MLVAAFEDDASPPRWPWVSAALATLWVGVFALGIQGTGVTASDFGLRSDAIGLPGALTFFALHASAIHLAVGLALLALSGPVLEARWGHLLFAIFLAVAIAGEAAATLLLAPQPTRPLVGASAALAALVAAAAVRFRRRGFTLRLGFGRRLGCNLWLPAFALPITWLGGAILVRAADTGSPATAGMDVRVQLGLAGGGALMAGLIGWSGLEERWLRRRERAARDRLIDARIGLARAESDAGRPDAGYRILESALETFPDPRIVTAFVEVAAVGGRRGDALARGARAVKDAWNAGHRDLATALWTPLVRSEPDLPLDVRVRLALAPILQAAGLSREAALTLRGELRGKPGDVTPGTALRIADAARGVHPPTAIEAAHLALESDALDAEKRARIEALIEALEADPRQLVAADLDAEPRRKLGSDGPAAPSAHARRDDPDPVDPKALLLAEASDSLDLDDPRSGDRVDEVEDPHALALEIEQTESR